MHDANCIVSELVSKLAELDQKVFRYRRDIVDEFEKYSTKLLLGVSADVSQTVSHRMAEIKKEYKALYPTERDGVESHATGTSTSSVTNAIAQPIPTPLRKIDENIQKEGSPNRSPHAREREFTGVFTPSYLPLLDSSSSVRRQISDSTGQGYKGKGKEAEPKMVDSSTEVTRSLIASPASTRPATPVRRNTDEQSEFSDSGLPRRSALRRTSSGSRAGSPRRVRFDVEGEEVLPTASPLPSTTLLQEMAQDTPMTSSLLDSDDEEGVSQIEDIDSPPPPKRISSTQRLRMMSRSAPEEDGVVWTAVTAPPDGSASVAVSTLGKFSLDSDDSDEEGTLFQVPKAPTPPRAPSHPALSHSKHSVQHQPPTLHHESTAEGKDELTEMASPSRQPNTQATILSPAEPADILANKSPTAATRPSGLTLSITGEAPLSPQQNSDDEVFTFDEHTSSRGTKPTAPASEDEEDESEEEFLSISPTRSRKGSQQGTLSSSAPRTIPAPRAETTAKSNFKTLSKSPTVGSVHPFSTPIATAEAQRIAQSAGNVETWVGSVDGRSGIDEGNAHAWGGSLRGNGAGLSSSKKGFGVGSWKDGFNGEGGEPKSLSERMMMEDEIDKLEEEGGHGRGH